MGSEAKFIYIAICIRKALGFFFFFFFLKKPKKNMTLQEPVGETVKMYRYGSNIIKKQTRVHANV